MKIKVVLTFLLLCVSALGFAQNKYILKANEAYARENYYDAAELCKTAYTKLTSKGKSAFEKKADMAFKAGECYRHTERYRDANEWYDRAILLEHQKVNPIVYLFNGDMLLRMREYDKAKANYEKYQALVPEDGRGLAGIESCEKNKEFIAEKKPYVIANQVSINKPEFDMSCVFGDRKETKLYFGSSRAGATGKGKNPRSGEAYMDLWISELDKKLNWTEPYLVKGEGINTEDDEGTLCFDDRGKTMFFTRCPNEKKMNLGCDIWMSEIKGKDEWKEPTKLVLKSHDSISVGHPCTYDGKFLIFASDMSGGFGGRDLWYTSYDRKTDSVGNSKKHGAQKSILKEMSCSQHFALNGDLLYSSDGKPGVWVDWISTGQRRSEKKINGKIQQISVRQSMVRITTTQLVEKDDRFGYFTSERKGPNGENSPDIYSYEQTSLLIRLEGDCCRFEYKKHLHRRELQ